MPVRTAPHRDGPVVEDGPEGGWRQGSSDFRDHRISSTKLTYPRRQFREVNAWRVGRYTTDCVLHCTFGRQADEMTRVVQPPPSGEIFGVGEVPPGRVFIGLHQAFSPLRNEPIAVPQSIVRTRLRRNVAAQHLNQVRGVANGCVHTQVSGALGCLVALVCTKVQDPDARSCTPRFRLSDAPCLTLPATWRGPDSWCANGFFEKRYNWARTTVLSSSCNASDARGEY